jgi:hypothetical protein
MAPTSTKKGRISQSSRAGIIFPVARIHRYLKSSPLSTARVTKGASVSYLFINLIIIRQILL